MSEEYQVTLPKLGESIVSATVVQWFKKEGDVIHLDEPLLEVSTDKVNSEIPSPVAGVLKKIVGHNDQELQVGELLAIIEASTGEKGPAVQEEVKKEQAATSTEMQDFYSPALFRLAKELNVPLDELSKIAGSGAGGRVSKRDLELYAEKKKKPCSMAAAQSKGTIERVKMTGMRRAIADNMVRSFYEAPHASLITEVDVTEVLGLIQREKESFLEKEGVKLTITTFVAHAITKVLADYPFLNSSLEGDTIAIKRFVNLGIAVSVELGIMVPVVKNAQQLTIPQLAKSIAELSLKARTGNLEITEAQEGTITLTNFGISGVMIGIPIIRYPEAAIIGTGAIYKKVVVLENESTGIRSVMNLSLTFDHRIIDGMYGCAFLNAVKEYLEKKATL